MKADPPSYNGVFNLNFSFNIYSNLLNKSPLATAVVTAAMFLTWPVKLPAIKFTLSVNLSVPATLARRLSQAYLRSYFSATRVTSKDANELSWSTIVVDGVFKFENLSTHVYSIFFDKSPLATAVVTVAMFLTWAVKITAIDSLSQSNLSKFRQLRSP